MNLLSWVFLESTAALAVLIGLSLFGLLVYWRRTLRVRPLLIGLGLSLVLLIVQSAVVTSRETAQSILDPIAADLMQDRTSALAAALTTDFRTDEHDRAAFLAIVRRLLDRVRIISASNSGITIERSSADRFEARASYSSNINVRDTGQGYLPSTWRFEFVRIGGVWKISRIDPVEILNRPMRSWRDVEGMGR